VAVAGKSPEVAEVEAWFVVVEGWDKRLDGDAIAFA
jgi:hypothetical protein